MSWLYTIVFAGLMFSSQGSTTGTANPAVRSEPVPVAAPAAVQDETEKFEQTYPLNAGGRVNVSNVNGSIVVEAWDRSEVKLAYTKIADSKERLADVNIKIESKPEYFSAETDYNNWKGNNGDRWKNGGKLNVEFRLMVPRGAVLNEVETVNGSVTVSNFVNVTRVSAVNGSVNATNIRGTAKLSTVNGEVKADFDRLESGSKISLETVNGSVNLVIPSDSNATIKADSLNGNISNDFGLPVRKGKYIGRDLYGRLGAGDVQIRLSSVNGALSMSRKNDGKTLSPAVNLLQQKDKDDSDWDNDKDDESINVNVNIAKEIAKADKEIAKAMKTSTKTSANISTEVASRALADAQRELNRLKPEMARITAESVAIAADAVANTAQIMRSDEMQQKMKEAQIQQREAMNRNMDYSLFSSGARVEKKSESFPVKGTPKVTVNATGCSVTIRGWDKSEVQYRVTQFADNRNRKPLNIKQEHNDTSVTLNVENVDDRGGAFYNGSIPVRIEVFVPHKSNLKIKSDGEIRLDGVSGDVELSGEDESINVRDVDGKLKLINADGRVRIIGFKGELDSRTGDGDVYLEGDFSKIVARGGDGSYHLTVPSDPNLDIHANIEALTIENLRVPTTVTEGHWRFGSGGADYTFKLDDGCVYVRSSTSLSN